MRARGRGGGSRALKYDNRQWVPKSSAPTKLQEDTLVIKGSTAIQGYGREARTAAACPSETANDSNALGGDAEAVGWRSPPLCLHA